MLGTLTKGANEKKTFKPTTISFCVHYAFLTLFCSTSFLATAWFAGYHIRIANGYAITPTIVFTCYIFLNSAEFDCEREIFMLIIIAAGNLLGSYMYKFKY